MNWQNYNFTLEGINNFNKYSDTIYVEPNILKNAEIPENLTYSLINEKEFIVCERIPITKYQNSITQCQNGRWGVRAMFLAFNGEIII